MAKPRSVEKSLKVTDFLQVNGNFEQKGLPLYNGTPQSLSGAGAVDVTSAITELTTTGADALTLADGVEGQMKFIVMIADGGAGTLTRANPLGFATLTFDDIGDSAQLLFQNGGWHFLGGLATVA